MCFQVKDPELSVVSQIFHELTFVSQQLGEVEQCANYYIKAMTGFLEINDQDSFSLCLGQLSSLYHRTKNKGILKQLGVVMNMTEWEIEMLLCELYSEITDRGLIV